jgi:hypothetical protein
MLEFLHVVAIATSFRCESHRQYRPSYELIVIPVVEVIL